MGVIDRPDKYLADKMATTFGEEDQLFIRRIKDLIMKSITELEHAPLKEKSKCAEALDRLIKIYLLLSGKATDRKELIEQRRLTLEAYVTQIKEEKGEEFLDAVDYQILEELESGGEDKV